MKIQRIALTLLVPSLLLSAKACSQTAKPENTSPSPLTAAVEGWNSAWRAAN